VKFTGIEIWDPYIDKYQLREKYDMIINQDVRKFSPQETFGISILGDVLEHMTKEEAIKVYNKLLNNSEYVIISIPIIYYPQEEYMNNPYERHIKDDWSHEEALSSFNNIALSYIEKEIGVYIGYNPNYHTKQDVLTANQPTYAVYGIYKNEEKFIKRFIDSVKEADEVVLCDTGSTDDTNNILETLKKNNPNINLKTYKTHISPWRFDDARNAAMSLVGKDIDICISLDIDEYLMENWREVLDRVWDIKFTRYYHKFKTILGNGKYSIHRHDRIHIRRGYCWKLPVHEILEYKDKEKACWIDDLWIYHQPDTNKPRTSYLPLLEQSIKERPDVWKTWSFLGGEYLAQGKCSKTINAIDRALQIDNSDKGFLYKQKYWVYKYKKDSNVALLCLNNYILNKPNRREPYFEKALYLHELNRNVEALSALKAAEKITDAVIDYHYNPNAWGEKFDEMMSKVLVLAKKELGL
jgi:glycosyltransferase involved in cell wall biosynthesis